MTPSTMNFGRTHLPPTAGLRVIEVGAFDVNGSYRSLITDAGEYIGIDIQPGPGVDRILNGHSALVEFGPESFDLVICTEVLEHEQLWRDLTLALKSLCRVGGAVILTTRSPGFAYHGYPFDYWRFTPDDLRAAFADMAIEALESDPAQPGVFILARRTGPVSLPPDLPLAPPA